MWRLGLLAWLEECLTGTFDLERSTFQLERRGYADHEATLQS